MSGAFARLHRRRVEPGGAQQGIAARTADAVGHAQVAGLVGEPQGLSAPGTFSGHKQAFPSHGAQDCSDSRAQPTHPSKRAAEMAKWRGLRPGILHGPGDFPKLAALLCAVSHYDKGEGVRIWNRAGGEVVGFRSRGGRGGGRGSFGPGMFGLTGQDALALPGEVGEKFSGGAVCLQPRPADVAGPAQGLFQLGDRVGAQLQQDVAALAA